LYKIALEAAVQGKDLDVEDVYLCPVCGHIEFGKPEKECPICGTLAAKYVRI
jgi:rubrerythrin